MAIDNTPPRLRLIATIAIIAIITLVSLDFVFKSYYAFMTDAAQHEKLAPRTALIDQLAAEHVAMVGAKVPIDQAMAQLKAARPESIEPKASDDTGALTGWAKLPKQLPLPPSAGIHAPAPALEGPAAGDAGVAADGGAALSADGGAALTADGGAPAPALADAGLAPAPKGGAAPAKDAGAHH